MGGSQGVQFPQETACGWPYNRRKCTRVSTISVKASRWYNDRLPLKSHLSFCLLALAAAIWSVDSSGKGTVFTFLISASKRYTLNNTGRYKIKQMPKQGLTLSVRVDETRGRHLRPASISKPVNRVHRDLRYDFTICHLLLCFHFLKPMAPAAITARTPAKMGTTGVPASFGREVEGSVETLNVWLRELVMELKRKSCLTIKFFLDLWTPTRAPT